MHQGFHVLASPVGLDNRRGLLIKPVPGHIKKQGSVRIGAGAGCDHLHRSGSVYFLNGTKSRGIEVKRLRDIDRLDIRKVARRDKYRLDQRLCPVIA